MKSKRFLSESGLGFGMKLDFPPWNKAEKTEGASQAEAE